MKRRLTLLVLLVIVFGGSSGASAVPITNGRVAGYDFSGNANDVSGNGATPAADRFGNANSAYSFNGVDDRIVLSYRINGHLMKESSVCARPQPHSQ